MPVHVLPEDELYERAAEAFVEAAKEAVRRRGAFKIALSGGSTPRRLYSLLAEKHPDAGFWTNTHVLFSDERCVPPDHPESNFGMAHDTLLSKAQIPAENIHRMKGELEPRQAAAEYSQKLRDVFGTDESDVPRFDLILLGIGEDGHTASIFPKSEAVRETESLVAAPYVKKLDTYRLTLTLPVIHAARWILVLVTGSGKAEAVKQALEGRYNPDRWPAQLIRTAHWEVDWFLDPDAARNLAFP